MTQQMAQDTVDAFLTGTGRLVQGTPYEKQTKDYATKQDLPPEKQKYYVGIAFMKGQDGITKLPIIQQLMMQAAAQHPAAQQFAAVNWQGFKFKIEDGDAPQHKDKPGWAGHIIVKFSNGYAPRIVDENQIDVSGNPDAVYRGCYVRLVGSVKQNGAAGAQAGIYVNFNTIQRVAHGERIITGPDTMGMLASAPVGQLPPGASAVPVGGSSAGMMPQQQQGGGVPGMGGAGMPGAMPGMQQPQQQVPMGGAGMPGAMPGMQQPQQQPQQQYAPQGMPNMPGAQPQQQPQQQYAPQGMPNLPGQQAVQQQYDPMQQQQQYAQQPQQQYAPQGMPQGMPQGQPQQQYAPQGMPGAHPYAQ